MTINKIERNSIICVFVLTYKTIITASEDDYRALSSYLSVLQFFFFPKGV